MTAQAERGGHTPGPWRIERTITSGLPIICATGRAGRTTSITQLFTGKIGQPKTEEAQANARLIVRACNLVMAGKALQDAQQAKITARGDLPPDLDWGLSQGEQAAALMMNALIEQNDAMLAALKGLFDLCTLGASADAFKNGVTDSTGSIDEGNVRASGLLDEARAAIAKAQGTAP